MSNYICDAVFTSTLPNWPVVACFLFSVFFFVCLCMFLFLKFLKPDVILPGYFVEWRPFFCSCDNLELSNPSSQNQNITPPLSMHVSLVHCLILSCYFFCCFFLNAGFIPPELGHLTLLHTLHLQKNELCGESVTSLNVLQLVAVVVWSCFSSVLEANLFCF